jgi:hypothetical protein
MESSFADIARYRKSLRVNKTARAGGYDHPGMLDRCRIRPVIRPEGNGEGILTKDFSGTIQANFDALLKACDFSRKFLRN